MIEKYENIKPIENFNWADYESSFRTRLIKNTKIKTRKNFKDKVSAKLYFDDTLIAETSSFPFKNEFKLTNQSIGIHKMKCAITVTSGNQKTTSYDEKSIVVTP